MELHLAPFAVTNAQFDIIDVIEKFDRGADNIYIVDDNGNYTGRALTANRMPRLWSNDFSCIVNVPAIEQATINAAAPQFFQKFPHFNECPVVQGAKIVAAVTKKNTVKGDYKWGAIKNPFLYEPLVQLKKIYLSSLEHDDIYAFYCQWRTRLPLVPLTNSNLSEALRGTDNLLIYATDIFPDIAKMSIHELWAALYNEEIQKLTQQVVISKDVAIVHEKDADNMALLIQKFDAGHDVVAVVNDGGKFTGLACLSTLRAHFPKKHFPKWNNLYLEYTPDEEALKRAVAETCFGSARRELPILQNGEIVATGILSDVAGEDFKERAIKNELLKIDWNIITDEVAKEFFQDRKKVLISSECGFLRGFKERFNHLCQIDVYDDALCDDFLNNKYDLLIYGAELWGETFTFKYVALNLYIDMLGETVRRYLEKNNVRYYFVNIGEQVVKLKQRLTYLQDTLFLSSVYAGEYFPMITLGDINLEDYNVTGNRRYVTNNPGEYGNKIYFFGPCTVRGAYVRDNETMESVLQNIINEKGYKSSVVNCGNGFVGKVTAINDLYRIMDTIFNSGDVVIHFELSMWTISPNERTDWRFSLKQMFDRFNLYDKKMFFDGVAHMNAEGYKIVAEFLFDVLKDKLPREMPSERKDVPAMFKTLIDANILPPLRKILLCPNIFQEYQKSA